MISIDISVIKTIYIYTILTDKIKHFFKEKLYNEIKKIHRPRFGYFSFWSVKENILRNEFCAR